jgi:hypothetical protein
VLPSRSPASASSQWHGRKRLTAYSCGGSYGIGSASSYRTKRTPVRTAFPIHPPLGGPSLRLDRSVAGRVSISRQRGEPDDLPALNAPGGEVPRIWFQPTAAPIEGHPALVEGGPRARSGYGRARKGLESGWCSQDGSDRPAFLDRPADAGTSAKDAASFRCGP